MKGTPSFGAPAGLFVSGRIVNLAVGLLMVPLLVHSLGGLGFATWAILLSCSIVFAQLQVGIPTALAYEVAMAGRAPPNVVARLWSSAAAALVVIHALLLPIIALAAKPVGEWLRLPRVGPWHPGVVILAVFICVAARSALLTGSAVLLGGLEFRRAAALSLAQALASNVIATVVAWVTRDLLVTLVAFWATQLTVAAACFAVARQRGGRLHPRGIGMDLIRRLLGNGVNFQVAEWAQTINFQFDKFVVVRVLGLWPAAIYEVANRSVLALRSIPASSTETMLPIAARQAASGEASIEHARRLGLLALYGVLLFCLVPLAVAPVFLYAWVGEMGYVSRHVFAWLAIGAAANLLALPVATLAQAAGHTRVQARAAIASIVTNVPLSLSLVHVWGQEGAAFGSSLAMLLGTGILLREARQVLGTDVTSAVRRAVVRHVPLVAVCLASGIVIHLAFAHWLLGLDVRIRYGVGMRAMGGLAAVALYGACVAMMLAVKVKVVGLDDQERDLVRRLAALIAPVRDAPERRDSRGIVLPRGRP